MTEEAGAVDSPQTEEVDVADVSTDDLRGMMAETEPSGAEQPGSPETETTEAVPEELAPVETEEERLAKRRIRPKSALDQQVLDLYKSEAFDGSFADASRVIYNQEAPQQSLQQAQEPIADRRPDILSQYDQRVQNLNAEVGELEGKVTEAADNLETAEALKLQREITRRELEVQRLSSLKDSEISRRKTEAYNTHRDKAVESRDRALETTPELQDENSVVRKQFDEYVRNAQQNPDYAAVFESPNWPELMALEFKSAFDAQVQQQQQPQQPMPPQQNPTMGTQAKVLTTGTTAQPLNAPVTEQQVAANMGQMSNDQLYALLGQDDGRRAPLR